MHIYIHICIYIHIPATTDNHHHHTLDTNACCYTALANLASMRARAVGQSEAIQLYTRALNAQVCVCVCVCVCLYI